MDDQQCDVILNKILKINSDAGPYAELVFNTFDDDGNGRISFSVSISDNYPEVSQLARWKLKVMIFVVYFTVVSQSN